MKKSSLFKAVSLFFLSVTLLGIIYACEKQFNQEIASPSSPIKLVLKKTKDPTQVLQAKVWFNKSNPVETKSDFGTKYLWEYAFTDSTIKSKTVEVPLGLKKEILFVAPECQKRYEETHDIRYLQNTTRLIIETDQSKGKTRAFYMIIAPSLNYLEITNFRPSYNTYLSRDDKFDGYILFKDLNGKLINGWKYNSGKISHKIKPIKQSSNKILPNTKGTITFCQNTYEISYTEWIIEIYVGGQLFSTRFEITINGISTSTYCWTETTGVGGGTIGGGADPGEADNTDNPYPNSKLFVSIFHGEGGSVTGSGEYDPGDAVVITATPNTGYVFAGWSNGIISNFHTFNISENMEFTAFFYADNTPCGKLTTMKNNAGFINYMNNDLRPRMLEAGNREHGDLRKINGSFIQGTNINPLTGIEENTKLYFPQMFVGQNKYDMMIHSHTSGIPFFSFEDIALFCEMYNKNVIDDISNFIYGAITNDGGMFLRIDDPNAFANFSNMFLISDNIDALEDNFKKNVLFNGKYNILNSTDHITRLFNFLSTNNTGLTIIRTSSFVNSENQYKTNFYDVILNSENTSYTFRDCLKN